MLRPYLLVQTVYVDSADAEAAVRLGKDLYAHLTRPVDSPLAEGARIPVLAGVAADRVDLEAAERVVLVPVLGAAQAKADPDAVLARLSAWHARLGPHQLLPVPLERAWEDRKDSLPGSPVWSELESAPGRRRATLDEIVRNVGCALETPWERVRLVVASDESDLGLDRLVAGAIRGCAEHDAAAGAFFEVSAELELADALRRLGERPDHCVLVAVRGDGFACGPHGRSALLLAKRLGVPSLIVEVLRQGEPRSWAYGGNLPTLVWNEDPREIVSRAMVEWLRARVFEKEARRAALAAGFPSELAAEMEVRTRPPELLDLVQGHQGSGVSRLVMHPDPELPLSERTILKSAQPRLRLVTPTTVHRRVLDRRDQGAETPLQGLQVALSLSDTPDLEQGSGTTKEHFDDVTIYLARSLVAAGAALAYGGDFRGKGFTRLLIDVIERYNQTAADAAELLCSYQSAHLTPNSVADLSVTTVLSDMRRDMARRTDARVILGGAAEPSPGPGLPGYSGRFPGVVEEAWRTLEARKPLYVVGGFGGAPGLLARLLLGEETPARLRDETWLSKDWFARRVAELDAHPVPEGLRLPRSLDDLADEIRELSRGRLDSDEASIAWNGLSVAENHALLRTCDPVVVASLVLRGLLRTSRRRAQGCVSIELVHGSVTQASELDLIAVAVFDDLPLCGAGAALEAALAGRVVRGGAQEQLFAALPSAEIDANWIQLASLGSLDDSEQLETRIERAAREVAAVADRLGLCRVGVVAFGAAAVPKVRSVVGPMLRGFRDMAGRWSLTWFEADARRFEDLRARLKRQRGVQLTTRRVPQGAAVEPAAPERLILHVAYRDAKLRVHVFPPGSGTAVLAHEVDLSAQDLAELCSGGATDPRRAPEADVLAARGQRLAQHLFGPQSGALLARCRDAGLVVVHDVEASRLPFESLCTDGGVRPALDVGLSRRLAVPDLGVERMFASLRPARSLRVLLVANPTEDLASAEAEAQAAKTFLEQRPGVELTTLLHSAATAAALRPELARNDVLHFCGHGFFHGVAPGQSGLYLAGYERFTLEDLVGIQSSVRLAFVNACESAKMRGQATAAPTAAAQNEPVTFAEHILRSGVDAYLGTYWEVGDQSAGRFALQLYTQLLIGKTLQTAVTQARTAVAQMEDPLYAKDWANYVLYGNESLRLLQGDNFSGGAP